MAVRRVGVAGGLVGLGVAAVMRFGKRPPQPVPRALAVRHAVVLAVAAGGSVAVAELLGMEHGYWVSTAHDRPEPDGSRLPLSTAAAWWQ